MGKQYFIYLPFKSKDLKEMTELWRSSMLEYICRKIATREGHRTPVFPDAKPDFYEEEIITKALDHPDSRKIPVLSVHGEDSLQELKQIGVHDVLYIVAHGCLNPEVISSGEGQYLKATELVARMVADQVPDRVLSMKLYCCGNAGIEAFAETMRLAMNKPFPRSDLYAYKLGVTANRIQQFRSEGGVADRWEPSYESHRASTRIVVDSLLRGGSLSWVVGRASDSRIRLARPLPDGTDEADGALYDDLIAGIDAVNRILNLADQLALASSASALATRVRADQSIDAFRPKYAAQSAD